MRKILFAMMALTAMVFSSGNTYAQTCTWSEVDPTTIGITQSMGSSTGRIYASYDIGCSSCGTSGCPDYFTYFQVTQINAVDCHLTSGGYTNAFCENHVGVDCGQTDSSEPVMDVVYGVVDGTFLVQFFVVPGTCTMTGGATIGSTYGAFDLTSTVGGYNWWTVSTHCAGLDDPL